MSQFTLGRAKAQMVKSMEGGSVIVDVAIDQGGSIATVDRVTTHSDPTYTKYGVVHYSVANMPGAVARTSTFALTNATLPYALQIANKGWYYTPHIVKSIDGKPNPDPRFKNKHMTKVQNKKYYDLEN